MKWIEEMKEEWRHDVEVLKAWVAKPLKMTLARPGCANTAPTPWKSWLRRKIIMMSYKGTALFFGAARS